MKLASYFSILFAATLLAQEPVTLTGGFTSGGGTSSGGNVELRGVAGAAVAGGGAGNVVSLAAGLPAQMAAFEEVFLDGLQLGVETPVQPIREGEVFQLRLNLWNTTSASLPGTRLEWTLPAGLELVGASSTLGTLNTCVSNVVLDLGAFAAGGTNSLVLSVRSGSGQLPGGEIAVAFSGVSRLANVLLGGMVIPPDPGSGSLWSGEDNTLDTLSTNHGTFVGPPAYGPGRVGRAFLASGRSLAITNTAPFRTSNFVFTVAAWVQFTNVSAAVNQQTIFSMPSPNPSYPAYSFFYNGQSLLAQAFGNGYATTIGFPWMPREGVWYFVAATGDGTNLNVFLNGEVMASGAVSSVLKPAAFSPDLPAQIGVAGAGGVFQGWLDEVRFLPRPLSGGELAELFRTTEPVVWRGTAPPGSLIFVAQDQTIWQSGADGSNPVLLALGRHPRLSPDGRYVMFLKETEAGVVDLQTGNGPQWIAGKIKVLDLHTGQISNALAGAEGATFTWGTNSERFIFTQYFRNGTFLRDTFGTNQARLDTFSARIESSPAVHPLDGRIVRHSGSGGDLGGLWLGGPDGANPLRIPNTAYPERDPSWSPDGQWLAFHDVSHWYKIRPDGSGRTRLTPPGLSGLTPTFAPGAWSPDGERLLMVMSADTNSTGYPFSLGTDGSGSMFPLPRVGGLSYAGLGGVAPVPPGGPVDLALFIDSALNTASVGTLLEAVLTISNRGPARATNVTLRAPLPTNAIWGRAMSESGVVSYPSNALQVAFGDLPASGLATVRLSLTPVAPGQLEQTFTASARQPDSYVPDNTVRLNLLVLERVTIESPIAYERANGEIWFLNGAGQDSFVTRGHRPKISPNGQWLLHERADDDPALVSLQVRSVRALPQIGQPWHASLGIYPAGESHSADWLDSGNQILYARVLGYAPGSAHGGLFGNGAGYLAVEQVLRLRRDPFLSTASLDPFATPVGADFFEAHYRVGAAVYPGNGAITDGRGVIHRPGEAAANPGRRDYERLGVPAWSADGNWLSIVSQGSIWKIRPSGGPAIPLFTQAMVQTTCPAPWQSSLCGFLLPGGIYFSEAAVWTLDNRHVVAVGRKVIDYQGGPETGFYRLEPGVLYAVPTDGSSRVRPLEISPGAPPVFVGSASTVLSVINPRFLEGFSSHSRTLRLDVPADDSQLRVESLPALGGAGWQALPFSTNRTGHDRHYDVPVDAASPAQFFRLTLPPP